MKAHAEENPQGTSWTTNWEVLENTVTNPLTPLVRETHTKVQEYVPDPPPLPSPVDVDPTLRPVPPQGSQPKETGVSPFDEAP